MPALSLFDICLAALLVLTNGTISVAFRLGLERTLAIAAARMVVQLGAIGFVLKFVFEQASPLWTALFAAVMIAFAGLEVRQRQTRPVQGWMSVTLGPVTLLCVGLIATVFVTHAVMGHDPWHAPRVFLPILGMILGNALTAVALTLETLTQTVVSERAGIEARLALGASRLEAFEGVLKRAFTTAMIPMINAMSVAGIVSLPGMMTGQILSGTDPVEAAKYQIMILFAIGGATALSVLAAALGGVWLLTDDRWRLRLDRLQAR